jgi:hypothetical protein
MLLSPFYLPSIPLPSQKPDTPAEHPPLQSEDYSIASGKIHVVVKWTATNSNDVGISLTD